MYAYYILHTLRIPPWDWIDRPYHEQVVLFALVDEKIKRDEKEKRKNKQLNGNSGTRSTARRRPRRRR